MDIRPINELTEEEKKKRRKFGRSMKRPLEAVRRYQKMSLTLYLKEPSYSLLSELVDRTGAGSKAEVVRRALEHYDAHTRKENPDEG